MTVSKRLYCAQEDCQIAMFVDVDADETAFQAALVEHYQERHPDRTPVIDLRRGVPRG